MKMATALTLALSAGAMMLTSLAEAQSPQPSRPSQPAPGGPQVQPPRPSGPAIQPPRPGRPEIQPPRPGRPEIQPPRPPRPQPPRPPRPQPPRPPVIVNPGLSVATLYSGRNWRGNHLTVRRAISDLRQFGFNDRAVSLRGTGRWQLCSKTNFRGRCVTVRGSQSHLGGVAGEVSSIRYLGR